MVNKFSKYRLKEKEDEGIVIEVQDIESSKDECERSLLGKIWGSKATNFTRLENTLNQLWCKKRELKVMELSYNYFQFIFTNKEEKDRVLLKRPWIFDNQFVVVHQWSPKQFKYNQLPIFCFYCGVVGHPKRAYELKMFDTKERQVSEAQYGDWIRAAIPIGGRKMAIGESSQKLQLKERGKLPTEEPGRKQRQKK